MGKQEVDAGGKRKEVGCASEYMTVRTGIGKEKRNRMKGETKTFSVMRRICSRDFLPFIGSYPSGARNLASLKIENKNAKGTQTSECRATTKAQNNVRPITNVSKTQKWKILQWNKAKALAKRKGGDSVSISP